jgi:hypothetical protein
MARATDLEVGMVLALENDLSVIESPRQVHQSINLKEVIGR